MLFRTLSLLLLCSSSTISMVSMRQLNDKHFRCVILKGCACLVIIFILLEAFPLFSVISRVQKLYSGADRNSLNESQQDTRQQAILSLAITAHTSSYYYIVIIPGANPRRILPRSRKCFLFPFRLYFQQMQE